MFCSLVTVGITEGRIKKSPGRKGDGTEQKRIDVVRKGLTTSPNL